MTRLDLTRRLFTLVCLGLCSLFVARAETLIEITGTGANLIPVAIAPLTGENALAEAISPTIRANLERSGRFKLIDSPTALPDQPPANLADWKNRGSDSLALGGVQFDGSGNATIRLRLYDTVSQKLLVGTELRAKPTEMRRAAHQLSDLIYEALTGEQGVFSTRIAYVLKAGSRYELKIADADGANPQMVFGSKEPIMSPSWSPEGRRIAYVSFEQKKPVVYVQDLFTGSRKIVAAFKGSNSAPAWAPDGQTLAVTLTLDGISQIYRISANGGEAQRLTRSAAIDTEASFSPDGQTLAFTSDRGGSPQIYTMPASGGEPQRLTFEGSYNVSPQFSRDGKNLSFITRDNGRFRVAILDLAAPQRITLLSDGGGDESPTFAPNSRMLLYATEVGGRGVLAAVSSDGRVRQKLSASGDVREPAWGPYMAPLPGIPMIPGLNK